MLESRELNFERSCVKRCFKSRRVTIGLVGKNPAVALFTVGSLTNQRVGIQRNKVETNPLSVFAQTTNLQFGNEVHSLSTSKHRTETTYFYYLLNYTKSKGNY